MAVNRNRSAHSPVNQLLRLVDTVGNRNHDNRLPVKPGHLHVLVCRNDNSISRSYLFPCEHILGAAGAVGLSLQRNPQLLTRVLQVLGSHIGVGNAGRAGSDRKHAVAARRPAISALFAGRHDISGRTAIRLTVPVQISKSPVILPGLPSLRSAKACNLCLVNGLQEFILILCLYQILLKPRIHQKGGQAGQCLQVYVRSAGRGRNHEQQMGQGTVKCLIVHPLLHHHGCQPGFLYRFHLCMGDGNPFADCSTAKGFPGQDPFFISGLVIQASACIHKGYQLINGLFLGISRNIQFNTFSF